MYKPVDGKPLLRRWSTPPDLRHHWATRKETEKPLGRIVAWLRIK